MIMPATQQSMLLLCISPAAMAFFIGIEVQKGVSDRWGRWRAPSTFWCWITRCSSSSASSSIALGQIVGCFLALMVILIVRDNSRARTGRVLLNQFVSAAVSSLTTNSARRKENHLPALYQQLFLLLNKFR